MGHRRPCSGFPPPVALPMRKGVSKAVTPTPLYLVLGTWDSGISTKLKGSHQGHTFSLQWALHSVGRVRGGKRRGLKWMGPVPHSSGSSLPAHCQGRRIEHLLFKFVNLNFNDYVEIWDVTSIRTHIQGPVKVRPGLLGGFQRADPQHLSQAWESQALGMWQGVCL